MKTKSIISMVAAVVLLAGCGADPVKKTTVTTKANGDVVRTETTTDTVYGKQLEAAIAINNRQRQPLCRLKAAANTPISGVESFECYAEEKQIVLPDAPQSTAAAVTHDVVGGVVTLGTYAIGGSAIKAVAGSIERAGTAGYRYVQAPAAPSNITNNIGGDAVVGSGALNGVKGTGAAGGNYSDTKPSTTTTTTTTDTTTTDNSTDNSNQGNGNPVTNPVAPAVP